MKLFFSPTSPYVRKVLAIAHETGLAGRIELVPATVTPVSRNATVAAVNPIGKIPALVGDDGIVLYDSRVICQYLDAQHSGPKLYPADGPRRWEVLRQEALADGLLDAALLARYEATLRPADKRWTEWSSGQMAKIAAGLDAMQEEMAGRSGIDAGQIAIGAALGYLDFRFSDLDWRTPRPGLAAWFKALSTRPAMQATVPKAPA